LLPKAGAVEYRCDMPVVSRYSGDQQPELRIDYSPEFSFSIKLTKAERVVSQGYVQWNFSLRVLIRHHGGKFTFEDKEVYFESDELARFDSQLDAIRNGLGTDAELTNYEDSFRLHLEEGRRLTASIRVRRIDAEMATSKGGISVDYDLFVNKLSDQLKQFIEELNQVCPEEV
jgi:hypothetical protein